jgi:hypothetical protein
MIPFSGSSAPQSRQRALPPADTGANACIGKENLWVILLIKAANKYAVTIENKARPMVTPKKT